MTLITANSTFQCIFGTAPSKIVPKNMKLLVQNMPVVLMTDVTFIPFGSCISPQNPGNIPILKSPPCSPVVTPWVNTSKTLLVGGIPVVLITSMATCSFASGIIKPLVPSTKVIVTK